jgi:hypothetical protein
LACLQQWWMGSVMYHLQAHCQNVICWSFKSQSLQQEKHLWKIFGYKTSRQGTRVVLCVAMPCSKALLIILSQKVLLMLGKPCLTLVTLSQHQEPQQVGCWSWHHCCAS